MKNHVVISDCQAVGLHDYLRVCVRGDVTTKVLPDDCFLECLNSDQS